MRPSLSLLLLFLLDYIDWAAPQSCSCSGHGICGPSLLCACHEGWQGPTCALRACPQGRAWVGYGSGGQDDVHSVLAECSGVGTCNTQSGTCVCAPGFTGEACGSLGCPAASGRQCGGRGRCLSMAAAAAEGNGAGAAALPYAASLYSGWEAERVFGCVCDAGWGGPDCAEAQCPVGPDPLARALPEQQSLACACPGSGYCSSGGFSVSYGSRSALVLAAAVATRAQESASAPQGSGYAPGESVQAVLDSLAPGAIASVAFSGGSMGACAPASAILVTFAAALGNVPPLVLGAGTLPDPDATLVATTLQDGTAELLQCSGRGTCSSGTCACLPGYYPSDGMGGPGRVLDCGSLTPPPGSPLGVTVVTKCLGNPVCSNRGWCDTSNGLFQCRCAKGWWGPSCANRACPAGRAWWDQPSPQGLAHALAPCSNRGRCNLDGTCLCAPGFTGASCNRLACPSTNGALPCSGNGRCLALRDLVPLGTAQGLPLGGGSPPIQTFSCSLASGFFTLTLRHAQTAAIAYDAPPEALALALENLGVLPSVSLRVLPRQSAGLYLTPVTLCSGGDSGPPVVTEITFHGIGGALPLLQVGTLGLSGWDTGSAGAASVQAGSMGAYGSDPFSAATWDAEMVQGCHCDGYPEWNSTGLGAGGGDRGRWRGPDCSRRVCPTGLVPLAPGGMAREVQALACGGAVGGTFTLTFRGQGTAPINFDAAPWEVEGALAALGSVGSVRVAAADGAAGVCGGGAGGAANNTFTVSFLTELGALPLLVAEGSALHGGSGVSLGVSRVTAGSGLLLECSGHGVCDGAAGLCACLPGYVSSNGAGGPGGRGDCGLSRTTGM